MVSQTELKVNKLLRVALINSYPEGQSHLVVVDGNTIITGHNSAGKTTLMGAIIPFYGARLSEVSRRDEATKSFPEFYLPYADSYIVYEYRRDERLCCAILRRSPSGEPIFNFVNAGYDESWFLQQGTEGSLSINRFDQVRSAIKSKGYEVSNNIKQSVYEAVISNCPNRRLKDSLRNNKDALRDVNSLRFDYSLATGKGSFYGFSSIASNILKKQIEISQICEFLVEAIKASDPRVSTGSLSMDSEQVNGVDSSKWLSDKNAWSEVERLRPQFDRLRQCLEEDKSNQQSLSSVLHNLENIELFLGEKTRESEVYSNELAETIGRVKKEMIELQSAWDASRSKLDMQATATSLEVAKLEKDKAGFEYGLEGQYAPLQQLQRLVEEIPSIKRDIADIDIRLDELRKKETDAARVIDKIKQHYKEDMRSIHARKDRLDSEKQLSLKEVESQNHKSRISLDTELTTVLSQINAEYLPKLNEANNKLTQLLVKKAECGAQLSNIRCSDEVALELEGCKQAIDKLRIRLSGEIKTQGECDSNYNQAKMELEALHSKLERLQLNASNKKLELEELEGLLNGDTLLSFLLKNESSDGLSSAVERIKATINPKLLSRQDLHPEWISKEESHAFYGMSLDLSKIKTDINSKQSLTPESITKKRLAIESDLVEIKAATSKLTNDIEGKSTLIKLLNEELHKARAKVVATENAIQSKEHTLQQLTLRAENEVESIRAKAVELLADVDNEIALARQDISSINHNKQAHEDDARKVHESKCADLQSAIQQQFAVVNDNHNKALLDLNAEAERVKQSHDKAINSNGYDGSVAIEVSNKRESLIRRFSMAEEAKMRVSHYFDFMNNEYSRHHSLTLRLQDIKAEILKGDQSTAQVTADKSSTIESLLEQAQLIDEDIKKGRQCLVEVREVVTVAQSALNKELVDALPTSVDFSTQSLRGLHSATLVYLNDAKPLIRECKKNIEAGISILKAIRRPLTSGVDIYKSLLNDSSLTSIPDQENWHDQATKFIGYLDNEHESKKSFLVEQYRASAYQVVEFKERLDETHFILSNFSGRVNRKCKEVCDKLEALAIEELHIAFSSKIKENTWYPALSEFSDAHQKWNNEDIHDRGRMPDQELLSKLQSVQNYINQNKMKIKLSEQFDFRLRVKKVGGEVKETSRIGAFDKMESTGTMRIAQLIIYISLLSLISTTRPQEVELKFFIDEIGVLDPQNTQELLSLLGKLDVSAMCAAPDNPHDEVIPLFTNNISCSHDKVRGMYSLAQTDDMESLTQDFQLEEFGVFS